MAGGSYSPWPITGHLDAADSAEHGYVRFLAQKFVDTLYMKAMQTESDLERLVTREEIDGNPMLIDAIKPLSSTDPAGELTSGRARFADLTQKLIPTEQRQMVPTFYDYMFYVDPRDIPAMNRKLDPTGQMLTSVLGAFNIQKDKSIITALDANVTIHDADDAQQGGSGTAFASDGGSNFTVAKAGLTLTDVSAGTTVIHDGFSATTGDAGDIVRGLGLNVKKLLEARKQLMLNNALNTGMRPVLLCHPTQLYQLLALENTVQSADYNAVQPLVTGELSSFLGMDIVTSNNVTAIANITDLDLGGTATDEGVGAGHYAYVFMPDALYYGCTGVDTKTDVLPEKGHTLQVASYMHCGAVRLDGKKIVRLECADTDTFTLV